MPEQNSLKNEIERGHFVRAAHLAAAMGREEEKIRELRLKALWQMAAVYRNAAGTRKIARQYGLSKEDALKYLQELSQEKEAHDNDRALEPCYDQRTGKYLSFAEWLDSLSRIWNRL
jgi:hypothetical protein